MVPRCLLSWEVFKVAGEEITLAVAVAGVFGVKYVIVGVNQMIKWR